jgi:hypothetical protein
MTTPVDMTPQPPQRRRLRPAPAGAGPIIGKQLKALPTGVFLYGEPYTLKSVQEVFSGESGGIQTIRVYEGDPETIRTDLRDQLRADGIRYRFDDSMPGRIEVYRDEAITGDGGTTITSSAVECWDLDWTEVNVRLSYAPPFRVSGAVEMAVLRAERFIDGFDPDRDPPWATIDFNTWYSGTKANDYRDKRAAGLTDWQVFRPILIHRLTEATSGDVQASNVGINQTWKIAPNSALNKLGDLKAWQFRKLPARKTLWNGKVSLEQRYDGAESWDADLYPPYSA